MLNDFIQKLDEYGFLYFGELIETIYKADPQPFFFNIPILRVGFGVMDRRPRPRYYTFNAIRDFQYLAINSEFLFGHRMDSLAETKVPQAVVMGVRINNMMESEVMGYINPDNKDLIEKIRTEILVSASADVNGKVSVNKPFPELTSKDREELTNAPFRTCDIVESITKVHSIDFCNRNQAGIPTAIINGYGNELEVFENLGADYYGIM